MPVGVSDLLIVGGGFAACSAMRYVCENAPAGWTIDLLSGPLGPGVGLAYASQDLCLRLNATHANMSLSVNARDEFTVWLKDSGLLDPDNRFAARLHYGTYLREWWARSLQLAETRGLKVRIHNQFACKISALTADLVSVMDGEDRLYQSPRALICEGPLQDQLPSPKHSPVISPIWPNGLAALNQASGHVVIIGTSLSAIDAASLALTQPEITRITMLSRHGRLPQAHLKAVIEPSSMLSETKFAGSLKEIFVKIRELASLSPWQNVMDVLRRQSNSLWQSWSLELQAYFMARLEPLWSTHRNRVMPEVLKLLDAARDSGRLEIVKAKFCGFSEDETGVTITTDEQGGSLSCDWLVDARGYQPITKQAATLCGRALADGYFESAKIGYGVIGNQYHRASKADLAPVHVVGAARFGDLIETTGAPEVRDQVQKALEQMIEGA